MRTQLQLRANIPASIIGDGKVNEITVLDQLLREPGAYYVVDRGFLDFGCMLRFHEAVSFVVARARSNLTAKRRQSHAVDRITGLVCDQTIMLAGFYSLKGVETLLWCIRFESPKTRKRLIILASYFTLPVLTIAVLHQCRWQVELFFKGKKQHFRNTQFHGTS